MHEVIVNFVLFCAYPFFALQALQYPEFVKLCGLLLPWIGKALDCASFYKFAFRKSQFDKRTWPRSFGCFLKFLLMICLTKAFCYINFHEATLTDLTREKLWIEICQMLIKDTPEILIGFLVAHLGFSKYAFSTPFFFHSALWIIYIDVGNYIVNLVTKSYYSIPSGQFHLGHPVVLHAVGQLLRHKHEPVMGLAVAGLLSGSLDIEMLIMNFVDHVLAGLLGFLAAYNSRHHLFAAFTEYTSSFVNWLPGKNTEQAVIFAVMAVVSFHIHYAFYAVLMISRSLGRKHKLLQTPFDMGEAPK